MIGVGYYRPDLAATNGGVSSNVLNALLIRDELGVAYAPHPSLQPLATATALPSAPRGICSVVTRAGQYQVFFGTADKLYKLASDGTYTQIGSGYAVPSGDNWSITQFGDYVYFSNTFDGLLRYNIETGGTVDAVSGAPKARFIFTLFGTMAALDCDGNNRLLKTSAINNPTIWSGDASNRYQEFADGEELIAGGELSQGLAVIFQRNAVRVLTRTRDRSIFIADQLAVGTGAQGADGVVITRGWAYFIDTDGPHRTNGSGIEDIGQDKVANTFIKSLAANALTSVQGAYDPSNNRIIWRYRKSSTVSSTIFNDALAYHINIGEWVPLSIQTAAIITMSSPGYSLDDLDQFGTLDTLPYPLDSRVWKGGEPRLAAVDADLKFGFVQGTSLECTLQTPEMLGTQREVVTGITPVTDSADALVYLGVKDRVADSMRWKSAVSIRDSGNAPVFGAGKIKTFKAVMAAATTWTFFRGFDNPRGAAAGRI